MQKVTFNLLFTAAMVMTAFGCERAAVTDQPAVVEEQPATQSTGQVVLKFSCGDERVLFTPAADDMADLRIGSSSYAMKRVVSASGAKYENTGNPDTSFWNKGSRALLILDGRELDECVLLADEVLEVSQREGDPVLGISWRLEDLDHTGIIDSSHLTVLFAEDGSITGSSGCNQYRGSYRLDSGRLEIDPQLAVTRKACAEALMFQEQKFLSLLPLLQTVALDETQALVLASPEGQTLTFRMDE